MPKNFDLNKLLRPVATPVDTYVRPHRGAAPQRPANSNPMLDIAEALSTVEPRLNRYLEQENARIQSEEEAAGAAAFAKQTVENIQTNRMGWKELIDTERKNDEANGTDNAERLTALSPHFKRGYMKAQLDSLGMVFEDHLLSQWGSNPEVELPDGRTVPLHQSDDPQALATWMHTTAQQFMTENGLDQMDEVLLAEAFFPRVRGAQQSLANRHGEYRLQEQRREYGAAFSQSLSMIVGGIAGTGEVEAGVAALQDRLDGAVMDGLPPRVANEILVDSILRAADQAADDGADNMEVSQILGVLDHIETGSGKLGQVGWVQEKIARTKDAIDDHRIKVERHNAWREERARDAALRSTMNEATRALLENPSTKITAWTEALIQSGNWSQALALRSTQDQLLNSQNNVRPNHRTITDLRFRISQASTDEERARLYQEIAAGVGTDYDFNVAMRLMDDVDQSESHADVFNDRHVAGWVSDLQRRIDQRFVDPVTNEVYDDTRGLEATLLFRDELSEWIERESADGIKPSPSEVRAKADELGAAILRNERFTFDERNPPKGGTLRTPAEQKTLGTRPAVNTIQTVMEAPQGAVRFSPETLSEADVALLVNDHLQRGQHSLLARIAANQGMDPKAVAQALLGTEHDPFAPLGANTGTPGQAPGPQAPANREPLVLEADPEVVNGVLDILDAGFLERNVSDVNLGSEATPLIEALREYGIVQEVTPRNGRGHSTGTAHFRVDFDTAMQALQPVIRQWGEAAGVDTRLLEPGRLGLSTDDPLALVVKEANIGTMTRRKGPGSRKITGIALTPEDKLRAIIHLMGNGSPE